MSQLIKYCTICGFAKRSEPVYRILEDLSIWDKNLIYAKNHYVCEGCLAEFILDIERYIETEPVFRFNFTK